LRADVFGDTDMRSVYRLLLYASSFSSAPLSFVRIRYIIVIADIFIIYYAMFHWPFRLETITIIKRF